MEDERNIVRRCHSDYVELDVPVVVDAVNIGAHPEQIWQTLTSPLHFHVSSQSLGGVLISVTAAGIPSQTVEVVTLQHD